MPEINQAFRSGNLALANFKVTTACFNPSQLNGQTTIVTASSTQLCPGAAFPPDSTTQIGIPSLLDSGQIFKIYGDQLCHGYGLARFANLRQNLLEVEKLSDEQFCQTFFIQVE